MVDRDADNELPTDKDKGQAGYQQGSAVRTYAPEAENALPEVDEGDAVSSQEVGMTIKSSRHLISVNMVVMKAFTGLYRKNTNRNTAP